MGMDIEKLATSAIEDAIAKTDYVTPYVNSGDKEPCWDGYLYAYTDASKKNEFFVGKVPVQVKGQKCDKFAESEHKYLVRVTDLKNFRIEGGTIYFNVGSEENKLRPVVVLQSDAYNFKSPVFTCAIISSSALTIPDIQVPITGTYPYKDENDVNKILVGSVDLGQIKTIGKERIVNSKICMLKQEIQEIDRKLLNALGLSSIIKSKENTIKSLQGKIEYMKKQ